MTVAHTGAILRLSWPILVAQLAVLANGVADTVMTGHYAAVDLAAIGIGSGIWVTVFVTLMGVIQGLSPRIAWHFGAGEMETIGVHLRQGVWLALGLSVPGIVVLTFPEMLLKAVQVPEDVALISSAYMRAMAWALPAALLVRTFNAFAPSIGRPQPVMVLNIVMLFIKIPISYALLHGLYGLPELGGVGCAVGSVVMFWAMLLTVLLLLRFDSSYHHFRIFHGSFAPHWPVMKRVMRIGVPIGVSQLVEVTSFTFMTLFIARLGSEAIGAHQIVANLAAVMFMVPLSLGIGTQILISQSLGRAGAAHARELAFAGMRVAMGIAIALVVALLSLGGWLLDLYTNDGNVRALALTLLPLLVVFHLADALQGVAVNALRGYQQTLVPTLIYVGSLWGIGLGGGWWLAFRGLSLQALGVALAPLGVSGMWAASAASLVVAGMALLMYLLRVSRRPS